jgi:hypothetical protein
VNDVELNGAAGSLCAPKQSRYQIAADPPIAKALDDMDLVEVKVFGRFRYLHPADIDTSVTDDLCLIHSERFSEASLYPIRVPFAKPGQQSLHAVEVQGSRESAILGTGGA